MGQVTRRPIQIDRASLLDLARGANLYGRGLAFLRELIQNAADATLVRLFEERGAAAFPTHEGSLRDLRAALEDRAIAVSVDGRDDASGPLVVRLRDRGTGISRSDVEYLGTLGASSRNPTRSARIGEMPEWMRPSGIFGIGLHSVFLAADEVRIRSTHVATGDSLQLRLFTDGDGVSLEVDDGDPLPGGGTECSVAIARDAAALDRIWHQAPRESLAFDALLEPKPDAPRIGLGAVLRDLGGSGVVPVLLHGERVAAALEDAHTLFDPQTGVELTWREPGVNQICRAQWQNDLEALDFDARPHLYYRGAALRTSLQHGLKLVANLHFGSARDLLGVSREQLSEAGIPQVTRTIASALSNVGARWLGGPRAAPTAIRPWISRALWLERRPEAGDAWQDATVAKLEDGTPLTLGAVAREHAVRYVEATGALPQVDVGGASVRVDHFEVAEADLRRLFVGFRNEAYEEVLADDGDRSSRTVRRETLVGDVAGASRAATAGWLRTYARRASGWRDLVPRPDGYELLDVDRSAVLGAWYGTIGEQHRPYRCWIVMPYVARDGTLGLPGVAPWIQLTADRAAPAPRTAAEVAPVAWRFLVDFDDDARASATTVGYELDAVKREIESAFHVTLPSVDDVRRDLGR